MTDTSFSFERLATDGHARAARFTTPHGVVETPIFMPVGTLATVKALDPDDLRAAGAQMILALQLPQQQIAPGVVRMQGLRDGR